MAPVRAPVLAAFEAACPDCPAARKNVFADLTGSKKGDCAFHSVAVEPRSPVPPRWFDTYGVGLVRRGVLIRQRLDPQGQACAIDAVGPGCVFPLKDRRASSAVTGYAASRLLVCLVPDAHLDHALEGRQAANDLVRLQAEAIERLERITEARGRPTADARVAALVCALADTVSPTHRNDRTPAGMQQRDLAALLGIRHETVCRVLKRLEGQGLLAREEDCVRIEDRSALESA